MTLANMRKQGVTHLIAYCLNDFLPPPSADRRVKVSRRYRGAVVWRRGRVRQVRSAWPAHRRAAKLEGSARHARRLVRPTGDAGRRGVMARWRVPVCAGSQPDNIPGCITGLMKQSPAEQLEDMQATLVRAIALLENQKIVEAHRLLFLLRGMIEGALADAQSGARRR
jgi:hypothetical protein